MIKNLVVLGLAACLFLVPGAVQAQTPSLDQLYVWLKTKVVPAAPTAPSPANGVTGLTGPVLTLACTAVGADSYDIRFGTGTTLPIAATGVSACSYAPLVVAGTTYKWVVTAKNAAGSTAGPTWTFTTAPLKATTSPSGTRVPRDAMQVVDAGLHVWTLKANTACPTGYVEILRDGARPVPAYASCGSVILWFNGQITNQGDDGLWYQYTEATPTWLLVGATAPDTKVGSIRLQWEIPPGDIEGGSIANPLTYALAIGTTSGDRSTQMITSGTTALYGPVPVNTTYYFAVAAKQCLMTPPADGSDPCSAWGPWTAEVAGQPK